MFQLADVLKKSLSRETAVQLATEIRTSAGERPYQERRSTWLLNKVKSGKFSSPNWSVAVIGDVDHADPNNWIRVDGQHSAKMLANLPEGMNFPRDRHGEPLLVVINIYRCDTEADLHDLFDNFNHPRSSRSSADYMQGVKIRYPELAHLNNSLLVRLADGIDMLLAALPDGKHVEGRYRGDQLFDDPRIRQYVAWIAELAQKDASGKGYVNAHFLMRSSITVEAFAMYRQNQDAARRFWSDLITESDPDPDSETRDLARNLNDLLRKPRTTGKAFRDRTQKAIKRYLRATQTPRVTQMPLVSHETETLSAGA